MANSESANCPLFAWHSRFLALSLPLMASGACKHFGIPLDSPAGFTDPARLAKRRIWVVFDSKND